MVKSPTHSLRASFSRGAKFYDRLATTQREIARRLAKSILATTELQNAKSILEIGCGTGFLTEELVSIYPEADLTVLDISPVMLDATRAKLGSSRNNINYIEADILDASFEQKFDLIVSSSTLQWVTELPRCFSQFHKYAHSNSYCLVSLFVKGTLSEVAAARAIIAPEKKVFDLPTVEAVCSAAGKAGLKFIPINGENVQIFTAKVHYDSGMELLQSISKAGWAGSFTANKAGVTGGAALLSRSELLKLSLLLQENDSHDESLVHGHRDSETYQSLDDLPVTAVGSYVSANFLAKLSGGNCLTK